MTNFAANPSGILVPLEHTNSVKCGYCPKSIRKDQEVRGRLFVTSEGKPICVMCRILRGKIGNKIRQDSKIFRQDMAEQRKLEAKQHRDRVFDIAIESQERHKEIITDK